jgi:hypothetical protein
MMKTLNITMLAMLVASSMAWAGSHHDHGKKNFERPAFSEVDANNDGDISFDEFKSYAEANPRYKGLFEKRDENGDGMLSEDEFSEGKRHKRGPDFSELDSNSDGFLTQAEMKAHVDSKNMHQKMFSGLDEDGNGVVSSDEYNQFKPMKKHHKRMKHMMFEEMDANGDGQISQAEAKAHFESKAPRHEKLFKYLDANEDGVITKDELKRK